MLLCLAVARLLSAAEVTPPAPRLLTVTTLADSGPGSLREAVNQTFPRTVVFAVAGTVALQNHLYVEHPFMTIAGQTAAPPGIELSGAGVTVVTHNVQLQHLRIRPGRGETGPHVAGRSAVKVFGRHPAEGWRITVEQCTLVDAPDKAFATWYGVDEVTLRGCLIHGNAASDEFHSRVLPAVIHIGDGARRVTLADNLLVDNPGQAADVYVPARSPDLTVTGNLLRLIYLRPGGRTLILGNRQLGQDKHFVKVLGSDAATPAGSVLFLADNAVTGGLLRLEKFPYNPVVGEPPFAGPANCGPVPTPTQVLQRLRHVGARPLDRHPDDAAAVTRLGAALGHPDTLSPGLDAEAFRRRRAALPADLSADPDGDGETALTEWLRDLSALITPAAGL